MRGQPVGVPEHEEPHTQTASGVEGDPGTAGGKGVGIPHTSGERLLERQDIQPTSDKVDASCDLNQVQSHVQSCSRWLISTVFCYNP